MCVCVCVCVRVCVHVRTMELSKAVHRHARCPSCELQQTSSHFKVKVLHSLHRLHKHTYYTSPPTPNPHTHTTPFHPHPPPPPPPTGTHFPEPQHMVVCLLVAHIVSVPSPVIHVDLRQPTQEVLQHKNKKKRHWILRTTHVKHK